MNPGVVVLDREAAAFQTINPTSSTGILAAHLDPQVVVGVAQASAAGTLVLKSGESSTNNAYTNYTAKIVAGTGAGQERKVLTYTGSTVTCTVSPNWAVTPDTSSVYNLIPIHPFAPKEALVTAETYQVRFRVDGGAPTATVGHIIAAGSSTIIKGTQELKNLRFIDTASGASTVQVTLFY